MGPILVVAENTATGLTDSTKECAGKGREISRAVGAELVVLAFGPRAQAELRHWDVDRVLSVPDESSVVYNPSSYEEVLAGVVGELSPYLIMIPNTTLGLDLGAGIAGRANLPLIAYCSDLQWEGEKLTAVSQVFAGKLLARIAVPETGAVITALPGSWPVPEGAGDPEVEDIQGYAPRGMRILRVVEPERGDVDITKADILVSVGRGIEDPENLPLADELAEALGGVVSCSRPVVDSGWLPKARQVGKSGQTVKPKVYFALGISGAPEHLQGMRDAELIIAVNTDEESSIMDVAHYGTTVDMLELMPVLAQRLRGE